MITGMTWALAALLPRPAWRARDTAPPRLIELVAAPEDEANVADATPEFAFQRRRPSDRRPIANRAATTLFVAWLRAWGFTGWHDDTDLYEFYEWFCDDCGVEQMDRTSFLGLMGSEPGVTQRRKRLSAATDPVLVRIRRKLEATQSLNPDGRASLYYVAAGDVVAMKTPTAARPKTRRPLAKSEPMRRAA